MISEPLPYSTYNPPKQSLEQSQESLQHNKAYFNERRGSGISGCEIEDDEEHGQQPEQAVQSNVNPAV